MHETAHADTFARDNLPPPEQWPDLLFELPHLQYPVRLNCGVELLDEMVRKGFGDRPAVVTPERTLTYRELLVEANRIAHVLRNDLHLTATRLGCLCLDPSPHCVNIALRRTRPPFGWGSPVPVSAAQSYG